MAHSEDRATHRGRKTTQGVQVLGRSTSRFQNCVWQAIEMQTFSDANFSVFSKEELDQATKCQFSLDRIFLHFRPLKSYPVVRRILQAAQSDNTGALWHLTRRRSLMTRSVCDAAVRADHGARTPPPRRNEPASGGALADALRRARVTADKNGPIRTKPR